MEEDLLKLDALFDSIIDEITQPELAGTFKNPFLGHKAPEIAELAAKIEDEEKRTDEIEEFRKYTQTKRYVEEVAKEKLGLVYDGEIIFQEEK